MADSRAHLDVPLDALVGAATPGRPFADHEHAVDEHPRVVVAPEGEHLGSVRLVGEFRLEFEGEVVVVVGARAAGVAEQLMVDREEPAAFDAHGVDIGVEDVGAVSLAIEGELEELRFVDAGVVVAVFWLN